MHYDNRPAIEVPASQVIVVLSSCERHKLTTWIPVPKPNQAVSEELPFKYPPRFKVCESQFNYAYEVSRVVKFVG